MRLINYIFLILFATILNYSCGSNKTQDEIAEIYNITIDNTVVPLPPLPPPEPGDNSGIPKQALDSINAIKLNIAVSKDIVLHHNESFTDPLYEGYNIPINNLIKNTNQILDKENWLTIKGHDINVVDLQKTDKNELFKKYNALVYVSNVGFNSTNDKAAVIIGVSYGSKLSGTGILFLVEKIDESWVIKLKKIISIA